MSIDKDLMTALVHLHRGELGRMTAYRQRLDTTTHLAVVTAGALMTFVLGRNDVHPHVLGLGLVLEAGFLLLEATRYRRFSVFKERVRCLETGFYGQLLGQRDEVDWKRKLLKSLEQPSPELGLASAVGVRLRTAHLSVAYAYAVAWGIALSRGDAPWWDIAKVGSVPGGAVVVALVAGLVALTIWAGRRGTELDA